MEMCRSSSWRTDVMCGCEKLIIRHSNPLTIQGLSCPTSTDLVAPDLAQLTLAQRQRRTEVVDDLAVELVAGALLLHVVGIEIAHGVQLVVGHLDGRLEHDPDDRLRARWSGQGTLIGPIGVHIGQQLAGITALGEGDAIALVQHELQQAGHLVQFGMVIASLKEHTQHGQAVGSGSRLAKRLVLRGVPVNQMQLAGIGHAVDGVLRSLGVRAAPVAVELLQLKDLIAQRSSSQFGLRAVDIHAPAIAWINKW